MGFVNGQVYENELIMGMTERECRSALLVLANAVEASPETTTRTATSA
jgi:hypothetical protein